MSRANYRVRRATLEDIQPLTALWRSMHFPEDELARRITEFQVAEGPDGSLIGAIGLQIVDRHGRVHSEAFNDFGLAESLRPLFWDRIHTLAVNLGLLRIWTQEGAPFWHHCGLVKADPETLEKLPKIWRSSQPVWLTVKFKEDLDAIVSADHEFRLFMQSERQRTEKTLQRARLLKTLATLIAVGLVILVIGAAVYLIRRNPGLLNR